MHSSDTTSTETLTGELATSPVGVGLTSENVNPKNVHRFARPSDDQVHLCNIMIVDDEVSVARTIKKHLQQAGFQKFQIVTDSNRAVTDIRTNEPDLVLLDLQMPLSGLQILEVMRRDAQLEHIPIIIFTADTDPNVKLKALTLGADDFITKPVDLGELVARVRNTLARKVLCDQITSYSLLLESDVLLDELTQAANRRAFDYELQRRLIEWKRQRTPLSLLMIDIDFFKKVNDRLGHQIGDLVLQDVSAQLQLCVREMDLVARIGGEEFAIIMPNTLSGDARVTADRIRKSISEKTMQYGGHRMQITVSVGVATSMNSDDSKMLVHRADQALYESKHKGRNRTYFHDGAKLEAVTNNKIIQDRKEDLIDPLDQVIDTDEVISKLKKLKVLAIDDEPSTSMMVRKLLNKNGFQQVITENDSCKAFGLIKSEMPDLVLMDIQMPEINGLEILKLVRENGQTCRVPVIILTSATDANVKIESLELGANDVLHKPVSEHELIARVKNTLLAKAHFDQLSHYSSRLEQDVRLRTAELMASRREAIQCLARAAEIRDDSTGHHILRVGRYAAIIAEELRFDRERVIWMEHAAQLHDVGKIGVPDNILKKEGKLTDEEYEYMKQHCNFGSNIIRDASHGDEISGPTHVEIKSNFLDDCNSPIMKMAAIVADTHHEKWDGTGYPRGLKGEEIPVEGRITAIADVFDALSTKRCYKEAFSLDKCFQIIKDGAGSHFDPAIVEAFERRRHEVLDVFYSYNESAPHAINDVQPAK
ncbi:MAG: response regulator [Mariniblastus sp.]